MDSETKQQIEALARKFREKQASVRTNLEKSVAKACLIVETEAKKNMRDTERDLSKSYKRGEKVHHPSAEFDYPAIDSGTLVRSITHSVESGDSGDHVEGRVGTNVIYGKFLEHGTSRMAPRPWLYRTLRAKRDEVRKAIGEAVSGRTITVGEA